MRDGMYLWWNEKPWLRLSESPGARAACCGDDVTSQLDAGWTTEMGWSLQSGQQTYVGSFGGYSGAGGEVRFL